MKIIIYILISYIKLCYCSDFKNLNEHAKNQFDRPSWEKNPLKYDLNEPNNLVLDFLSSSTQHTLKNTEVSEYTTILTYTPEHNYYIREVTEGTNLVWRCSIDFEFANNVDLVQKNGLTQLITVKNNQTQLFFKRQNSKFVNITDLETFTKLHKSLEEPNTLLDKWVELDLSNPVPNRSFFFSDLVYVDGVPKFTVKTLENLDLYRVYDSKNRFNQLFPRFSLDTLWTYENNIKCNSLLMYMFDELVLLHLVLSNSDNLLPENEHKYFKKESDVWHSMGNKEFYTKFDLLKSKIVNTEISFDLNLTNKTNEKLENVFYKKTKKLPQHPDLTLYPKTSYHLKKLLYNDTELSVLEQNERFSPVELYIDNKDVVLVKAFVWKNKSLFKNLYFKKTNRGFVSVQEQEFELALAELKSKIKDEKSLVNNLDDLDSSSEDEEDSEEELEYGLNEDSYELEKQKQTLSHELKKKQYYKVYFRKNNIYNKTKVKFNVKFDVDEKYFRQQKSMDGEFELHTVNPKDNFLVDLVDSKYGVVWKSTEEGLQVKSLMVYFKEGKTHALKLNVVGPKVNKFKYFTFTNNKWMLVNLDNFYKTLNKDEESFQIFDY